MGDGREKPAAPPARNKHQRPALAEDIHRLTSAALAVATVLGPAPAHAGTTAAPAGRQWSSFAYDAAKSQLVLFGGNKGSTIYGDTWARTGGTWAQLHPATSPSPRTGASMVCDPATQQLLLFGGGATPAGPFNGDTWTLNGTMWTQLHPATSPPGRSYGTMTYNGADQRVVLTAGKMTGTTTTYPATTWSWTGSTWSLGS